MATFETTLGTLAEELDNIEAVFRGLSHAEWAARTQLVPVDPTLPHGQFSNSPGISTCPSG